MGKGVIITGAIAFGVLAALSLQRYTEAADQVNLTELKTQFVMEAQIGQAHNEVAQAVGLKVWKAEAKPWFLREVTKRAALDAGTPFPTAEEIKSWAKTHPDTVKELLKETGARFEPVKP